MVINAVSAKMGGAVTYITNLLRHLPGPESGYEFLVFLPPETAGKQSGMHKNVRLVPTTVGHRSWWRRLWWEQATLRRLLLVERANALFSSANFAMFRCPVRQVLLVRIPVYFSRTYSDVFESEQSLKMRMRLKFGRWLCCRSVRAADVVMTPTRAMMEDLRRFVDVPTQKAVVNPYGVALADASQPGPQRKATRLPQAAQLIVCLLYVSLYIEQKNLSTLLKALPLLNRDSTVKFLLRTTADPAWNGAAWTATHKRELALACQPDVAQCVEFIGPLPNEQVQDLYRRADLFVFPSLCESFGHPMVEAMAHGLPIVASDTPVNREICGEAALYFRPRDPKDLAEKVQRLYADEGLWQKCAESGFARTVGCFKWKDHVARLLRLLAAAGETL